MTQPIVTAAQARAYLEEALGRYTPITDDLVDGVVALALAEPADLGDFDRLPDYMQDGGLDR